MHQVNGNSLVALDISKSANPPTIGDDEPWDNILSSVAWAIRSTYHKTLEAMPGQLVFGRDMLLPIAFQANWAHIQNKKQMLINKNSQHENRNRQHHIYHVGDLVMLEKPGIVPKMDHPCTGPHEVL